MNKVGEVFLEENKDSIIETTNMKGKAVEYFITSNPAGKVSTKS